MVTDEAPVTTETPPEETHAAAPASPKPEDGRIFDASSSTQMPEESVPADTPVTVTETARTPAEPPGEPPTAVAAPPAVPPPPPSNKRWYVVKVQSGREETIREAIERKVKIEGLEEYYGQIYIPTEQVTEMRNSKRYTRHKKSLPGYIMAEVEYNDRILYLFRETSGVGDFVGGTNNKPPPPMTDKEVGRWLKPKGQQPEEPQAVKHDFEKGDKVKVKDGMFKDMEGEIKEILEAKNQAKVELTIFGRPVMVEMEYWQVERV